MGTCSAIAMSHSHCTTKIKKRFKPRVSIHYIGVFGRTYTPVSSLHKISLLVTGVFARSGDILHGGYMNLWGFVDCVVSSLQSFLGFF